MLKNISNLGKALNKAEQKEVNGGKGGFSGNCYNRFICPGTNEPGELCIASPNGVNTWGTVVNGQCCV